MGTRLLRPGLLFDDDAGRGRELRPLKQRLLAENGPEVSVALSGAEAAAEEAAQVVAQLTGQALAADLPPLEAAALLVPDDLVVLVRRQEAWCMGAGVVCFPSHWSPPAKLDLPVARIHGPVPGYAEELSQRVDRFLDNLAPRRPVWRRNWTVHASPELHCPEPVATAGPVAPEEHWLRTERQTLSALPRSGGVLFTIGTSQLKLSRLAQRPDIALGIASALRATPPDLARYRFGGLDISAIATWLEASRPNAGAGFRSTSTRNVWP